MQYLKWGFLDISQLEYILWGIVKCPTFFQEISHLFKNYILLKSMIFYLKCRLQACVNSMWHFWVNFSWTDYKSFGAIPTEAKKWWIMFGVTFISEFILVYLSMKILIVKYSDNCMKVMIMVQLLYGSIKMWILNFKRFYSILLLFFYYTTSYWN